MLNLSPKFAKLLVFFEGFGPAESLLRGNTLPGFIKKRYITKRVQNTDIYRHVPFGETSTLCKHSCIAM